MKYKLIANIEINTSEDLTKLNIIVEANHLEKPNFSEIERELGVDYGFKVSPCIVARPNTKAKVENPMTIIDEIMTYNGTLESLEQLHEKLEYVVNEANTRSCQATGVAPILAYKKEKEHLHSLP